MGRRTKENIELTEKRVITFLLDRDDTKAKLTVVTDLLTSLQNTKKGERHQKINDKLVNSFKVLCVESTDLLEWKHKYNTGNCKK